MNFLVWSHSSRVFVYFSVTFDKWSLTLINLFQIILLQASTFLAPLVPIMNQVFTVWLV